MIQRRENLFEIDRLLSLVPGGVEGPAAVVASTGSPAPDNLVGRVNADLASFALLRREVRRLTGGK